MRVDRRWFRVVVAVALAVGLGPVAAGAAPELGDDAPPFEVTGIDGKDVSLTKASGDAMTVLYFFKAGSKISTKGLDSLQGVYGEHADAGVSVLGLSRDGENLLRPLVEDLEVSFPVASEDGGVHSAYGVEQIIPTTFVLDTNRRIIDIYQGGGQAVSKLLTRIASREVNRNSRIAKAAARKSLEIDPADSEARVVVAKVLIDEGDFDRAAREIGAIEGNDGRSKSLKAAAFGRLALARGDAVGAKERADEAARLDPSNGGADLLKGELSLQEGDTEAAGRLFAKAAASEGTPLFQRAMAFNNVGRVKSELGEHEEAEKQFAKAASVNPLYAEAMSNRGVALAKLGRTGEAKAVHTAAAKVDPSDEVNAALLRVLEERERFQQDQARQAYVDQKVEELVARAKAQAPKGELGEDDGWTSKPMVVAVLPLNVVGMSPRPGTVEVLQNRVADGLAASERVQVVDREILDKVMAELNLGSSDLADADASLKLGRVLAARVLATGTVIGKGKGLDVTLRLVDTETTKTQGTVDASLGGGGLEGLGSDLARGVVDEIRADYPLQGVVAEVDDGTVIIDLGSAHGARAGLELNVVKDGAPVKVGNKIIGYKKEAVGQVRITEVQEGMSFAEIVEGAGRIEASHKVVEPKP